jgi:hypothetical protein
MKIHLPKMYNYISLTLLIQFISIACYTQENAIKLTTNNVANHNIVKAGILTVKDSCLCKNDSLGRKLILQTSLNNNNLIITGIQGETNKDNPWGDALTNSFGGIRIINCNNCKIIKEIALDNMHWYSVEAKSDTVLLNYYIFPIGEKPFVLYQIVYTNENDSITFKYRFHKDFDFANKNELSQLKKGYTSITRDSIGKENMNLNFQKIDHLGWQLFYAAISGDAEAKKRLLNYKNYYSFINAAYEEVFLLYPCLYNELKEFQLIENK